MDPDLARRTPMIGARRGRGGFRPGAGFLRRGVRCPSQRKAAPEPERAAFADFVADHRSLEELVSGRMVHANEEPQREQLRPICMSLRLLLKSCPFRSTM